MSRRPVRKFPKQWFSTEDFTPGGGGEPREEGFTRSAHAANLLAGIRQAALAKPKAPLVPDSHIFFAARTWKDRPSLRKSLDRMHAKVHRVLSDGVIVSSWRSRAEYEETRSYISEQYRHKQTITADLDYVESVRGLEFHEKLGRSILAILDRGDEDVTGLLELSFYPDYAKGQIEVIVEAIRKKYESEGLVLQKLVTGVGRFSAIWHGRLALAEDIAKCVEAVALVEQAGELQPAQGAAKASGAARKIVVAKQAKLPEVAIMDTGVQDSHPALAGVVLSGDTIDRADLYPDGGHGTFVAGVVAYGEELEAQWKTGKLTPRAHIHPKKVAVSGQPGGVNLDNYQELATAVEALRTRTKVFTCSLSTTVPLDSDNVSTLALNIDLVSQKYGVLFVLPTGNLPNYVNGALSTDQPNFGAPHDWFSDPNAQMGRPGEAFNALTVSSYAERQVGDEYASPGQANVYSRRGPGPKLIPKPDLAEAGGNCQLLLDQNDPSYVAVDIDTAPGAAITNLSTNANSPLARQFGTSFAVPKVAFALARLVMEFEELNEEAFAALLAKAYIVHISRHHATPGPFPAHWTGDEQKRVLHLLYGHGVPDHTAMTDVPPSEMCFYYGAEIGRRERHVYSLKLPANIIDQLPDLQLRVTLAYFTKVDPTALDAELYSLVDLSALVRWGGKTLAKTPRGGPLTDFYPIKSFEVRFSKPREGEAHQKGQPTVEVTMRDRAVDVDDLRQRYAIVISLVSKSGELLVYDMVQELA
jgi:hypothetical protein